MPSELSINKNNNSPTNTITPKRRSRKRHRATLVFVRPNHRYLAIVSAYRNRVPLLTAPSRKPISTQNSPPPAQTPTQTTYRISNFNETHRHPQLRTRSALLESLTEDLQTKTAEFLGAGGTTGTLGNLLAPGGCPVSPTSSNDVSATGSASGGGGSGSRFIDTVRKALISRVRNASTESVPQQLAGKNSKAQSLEPSPPSNRPASKLAGGPGATGKRSVEPSSPLGSPDLTLRRLVEPFFVVGFW